MNEKDLEMLNEIVREECLKYSVMNKKTVNDMRKSVCRRLYGMSRDVDVQKGSGETRSEVYIKQMDFEEWWEIKTTKTDFFVQDLMDINDIYQRVLDQCVQRWLE